MNDEQKLINQTIISLKRSRTNIFFSFCVQSSILNHQNERAQKQINKKKKQLGAFSVQFGIPFLVMLDGLVCRETYFHHLKMILCWTRALSNGSTPAISFLKRKTTAARVYTHAGDEDGNKNVMSSIVYTVQSALT